MMKIEEVSFFDIAYKEVKGVYMAGQTVQGQLVIELTEDTTFKAIRLAYEGSSLVDWIEYDEDGKRKNAAVSEQQFTAEEKYFNREILLDTNSKTESENIELSAGSHRIPFSFVLPPDAPSSFEGPCGFVRYFCQGIVDQVGKSKSTKKSVFKVVSRMELSKYPDAQSSVTSSGSKQKGCLCCVSGPVSAVFTVKPKGYVPGEKILLNAEIDNKSNSKITSSSVALKMRTVYKAKEQEKVCSYDVATILHGTIAEGDSYRWDKEELLVPQVPPTNMPGCKLMDISYTLELIVTPQKFKDDLVVPLDIFIGSIPFPTTNTTNATGAEATTNSSSDPTPVDISGADGSTATDQAQDAVPVIPVETDASEATDQAQDAVQVTPAETDASEATDQAQDAVQVTPAETDASEATDQAQDAVQVTPAETDGSEATDQAQDAVQVTPAETDASEATDQAQDAVQITPAETDASEATDQAPDPPDKAETES